MALKRISDSILYVGADDRTIDLFENQYPVSNGVTYNSYVIKDSKIAVMWMKERQTSGLIILKKHLRERHRIIL